MFYKKEIDGSWWTAKKVSLPNGDELDENNRENDYGWEWHDEPPQEYLDWLEEQEQDERTE